MNEEEEDDDDDDEENGDNTHTHTQMEKRKIGWMMEDGGQLNLCHTVTHEEKGSKDSGQVQLK